MATDEKEIPDPLSILKDLEGMQERLDKGQVPDPLNFLKNDLVPTMKDLVEAMIVAFEDVQDEINPIKLTGGEAKEALTLFQAALQTNPQLKDRFEPLIETLSEQLGEDDDEPEAEQN